MMNPPAALGAISVLWDVKMCPVHDENKARRVSPWIKRFLRTSGYFGPITITAVGVLSDLPHEILEAVSSTGISLYNGPYGTKDMDSAIHDCIRQNLPPANIMIIYLPLIFHIFTDYLNKKGYNFILPFPADSTKADVEDRWKDFLLQDPEEDKCSETGAPALWVCAVCDDLTGRGFESFIEHISTPEHKREIPLWFPPEGYLSLEAAVKGNVDAPLENAITMAPEDDVKHKKRRRT